MKKFLKIFKFIIISIGILGGSILNAANDTLTIESYITAKKWDAKKTDFGVFYVTQQEGKGKLPTAKDYVKVKYSIRLLNDKIIENTSEPIVFQLGMGQVIAGWEAGMTLVRAGGRATLLLPPDLAYGATGADEIPPDAAVILEVELLEIMNQFAYEQFISAQEAKEKQLFTEKVKVQYNEEMKKIVDFATTQKLKIQTTNSGLSYVLTQKGAANLPKNGAAVTVQYEGTLLDGTVFDKNPTPYTFRLGSGKLLDGWEEGLRFFGKGAEGFLIFPSKLAYGNTPIELGNDAKKNVIPENSILVFKIKIIEIK